MTIHTNRKLFKRSKTNLLDPTRSHHKFVPKPHLFPVIPQTKFRHIFVKNPKLFFFLNYPTFPPVCLYYDVASKIFLVRLVSGSRYPFPRHGSVKSYRIYSSFYGPRRSNSTHKNLLFIFPSSPSLWNGLRFAGNFFFFSCPKRKEFYRSKSFSNETDDKFHLFFFSLFRLFAPFCPSLPDASSFVSTDNSISLI